MAIFKQKPSKKAIFPLSRGKNRISQGVENRGSLISVPLALRETRKQRDAGETANFEPLLSGPLQLRVQSRSRTRLRIAAQIAFFVLPLCAKEGLDIVAPLSRDRARWRLPIALPIAEGILLRSRG